MSLLQSKLSAEKIPAEQWKWNQHLKLPTKLILPLGVLPGVPVGTFVVRSVGHLGKKIQNLSGTLFAFEIFGIAQKTKK